MFFFSFFDGKLATQKKNLMLQTETGDKTDLSIISSCSFLCYLTYSFMTIVMGSTRKNKKELGKKKDATQTKLSHLPQVEIKAVALILALALLE